VIVTVTAWPFFLLVTLTVEPKGSDLCAAVMALSLIGMALAVYNLAGHTHLPPLCVEGVIRFAPSRGVDHMVMGHKCEQSLPPPSISKLTHTVRQREVDGEGSPDRRLSVPDWRGTLGERHWTL
jgi:hypothetical protein